MEQHIQTPQSMFFRGKTKIIAIAFIVVILGIGIYFWMKNEVAKPDEQQNTQTQNQSSSFSDDGSVSAETNPKDYSLVDYPLKESPVYDQLKNLELKLRLKQAEKSGDYGNEYEFCFDSSKESWTVQKDTRLVKNSGEIVIPSIRQLIFASENKEPNCVTEIGLFSAPTDGKYLYLTVSELSFKEGMSWPVYRLDLSNLSVEKLLLISVGGDIQTEEGFILNENKLLPDGKRVVRWNDKDVFLVNLETDSRRIIYTAPDNQWLVSNVNPSDVIGKFLDTDVKVDGNQVTIGVYDQNKTFTKNPSGYQDYDINYVLVNQVTIPIPAN